MVSGTVLCGQFRAGDTLLLGPDALGKFEPIQIKSIHRKRMVVREVHAGHSAALALKKVSSRNVLFRYHDNAGEKYQKRQQYHVQATENANSCRVFVAIVIFSSYA